ncbi:GerMN domain-containing protein [Lawsonibacter sp. LCP25S3_G6]|uniref:GerMN domain-containing protein n=1 Tax=unclassified Lawsonibacter TaxID=2617946 RepID=UPI003F982BC3
MKSRCVLAWLLSLLVLLCACGRSSEEKQRGDYVLYFLSGSLKAGESGHGPALDWEPYDGEAQPEALLDALLAGPTLEELASPFPKGVTLRKCVWDEERPGVLVVSLSEQYGALTDVSLTLADYCIVLTLSQLEDVEGVEIRSGGYGSDYRSHQLLQAEEALLADRLIEQAS